jgi:hypothetical protein
MGIPKFLILAPPLPPTGAAEATENGLHCNMYNATDLLLKHLNKTITTYV